MFIQTLCFFLRDVPLFFRVGRLERLPGGRYGVCVSECAQEGQVVEDYGHARQDFVAGASALFSRLPALLAISKAHGESEY